MKIKIVSDLHLEFSDVMLPNNEGADVLILSGDIMIAQDLHDHVAADFNPYSAGAFAELGRKQQRVKTFRDFLSRCSFQYPKVVYVAGNHEFYHGKFFAGLDYLREECAKHSNVHFLENESVEINNVVFIGGTLWTDMNKGDPITMQCIKDMMNDFRIIRNDRHGYSTLRPSNVIERHIRTKEYISNTIKARRDQKSDSKIVVVTHHSPSLLSCHPRYSSDHVMNGGYHSDLSEFIFEHPEIALWTHGHTHHAFDYTLGSTRIVCNPRGYESPGYSEDTGWDPTKIVEV